MTTTDMQKGTSASIHDLTEDSAVPQGDDAEATRSLLAKARFDAFQVVTEARKEAESILDGAREEAAEIVTAAKMQAESIVDAARLGADEVRSARSDEVNTESASDAAAAESSSVLEAEHDALVERVTSLRAIADQLEERFAALAASAGTQRPSESDAPTSAAGAPVLDYSPSVAPRRPEPAPGDHAAETAERGSFYNRRSAKLPSIGDAGGRSALDMMKSIRETMDDKAS